MVRLIACLEDLFMICIFFLCFYALYAKIISIKTIKDLKYFSLCAMNWKCMKVYICILTVWKIMNFITICYCFWRTCTYTTKCMHLQCQNQNKYNFTNNCSQSLCSVLNTSSGCILGRVTSDISHQGFGSREHHTPHSGDPAHGVKLHLPWTTQPKLGGTILVHERTRLCGLTPVWAPPTSHQVQSSSHLAQDLCVA